MPQPWLQVLTLVMALTAGGTVAAQSVSLSGIMGQRALLVVDGAPPRTVAPGESHLGVRLISVSGAQASAVVEMAGRRHTVGLGEAPVSVGSTAPAPGRGNRVVLTSDGGGHFMGGGQINGQTVQFMVDTGASVVALGSSDADRMGLNYRTSPPVRVGTANGMAQGWRVKFASVRLGDVELFDVDGIVTAQPMPFVLLGNSFLNRFQMRREADLMVLERRY